MSDYSAPMQITGMGMTEPTRWILPYTPPVGNQPAAEQKTAQAAATKQAQQSVQLTDYTYIQQTDGVGVGAFTVVFDVAFTEEPTITHGMSLADFAAEIRQDLVDAQAGHAAAKSAADAFQWQFPGNITIGAFQSYDSGESIPERATFKFAVTGIVNSQNDGKKITLVGTGTGTNAAGKTFTANLAPAGTTGSGFGGSRGLRPVTLPNGLAGYGTIDLPNPGVETMTWQLFADGQPLTATGGFDVADTHQFTMLSADAIAARKAANDAGTLVGDILQLGGNPDAYPLCAVYVKRWLLNNQKNYIGADCIVVVRTFGAAPVVQPPGDPT